MNIFFTSSNETPLKRDLYYDEYARSMWVGSRDDPPHECVRLLALCCDGYTDNIGASHVNIASLDDEEKYRWVEIRRVA